MVVSTYSITDERKQKVDFAGPYFVAHQDLLIRRNDEGFTGPESLDGKNLCSVAGTTSAAYVKANYQGRIQLQEYRNFSECVDALAKGQIDAVTTDDVILAGFAALTAVQGHAQGRRQGVHRRALRHRAQEGRQRHGGEGQRRPEEVHRRRHLEDRAGQHGRPLRLQHPQPADPRDRRPRWHDDRRVDRRARCGPGELPRRIPAVRPSRRADPLGRRGHRAGRRVCGGRAGPRRVRHAERRGLRRR